MRFHSFIVYLFIFSTCVILVRFAVDPETGIHPGYDTSPSQGTIYAHTHTKGQFIIANPSTSMFL